MTIPQQLLALCFLACPAFAQGITLVQGNSPSALDVVVIAENNVTQPGTTIVQGIEFTAIELSGRYASQELRGDVARRITRNGFMRIELPLGGRLLQYKRNSGRQWGYLLVPPSGQARVVLELPGTAAQTSPFGDRVAVAADGAHMLVPVAGGCFVVKLDGTVFASTGAESRFVATARIDPRSPMVGRSHAFFTGNDAMWRLPLADGGTPANLTPPGANFRIKDQLAMSGDGATVAFLWGASNLTLQIYLLDSTSAAARLLAPPPAKYEEPGYLPEDDGNLRLLLNDDASRLFYVDATIRDESWLMDTATSQPLPPVQITEDNIFQPYIGVHILPSFQGDQLLVSIGDINQMDWFKVALAQPAATVQNLTATGSATTPFPAGTMQPDSATWVNGLLMETDVVGGSLALRAIDPQSGTAPILQTVMASPITGSSTTANADLFVHGAVDGIYDGRSAALIGLAPQGTELTPPVHAPHYSATWWHLPIGWGTVILYFPGGAISGGIELGVQQIVFTQSGNMIIRGSTARYLSHRSMQVIPLQPTAVQSFLSGAGG